MKVSITKGRAVGQIKAPPSKSYAHRLLICAGLAYGDSIIRGIDKNEDVLATVDCLTALGAKVSFNGDIAAVSGCGGHIKYGQEMCCRESGSTLRFMIPISLLGGGGTFKGSERLISRGIGVYEQIFADFCNISSDTASISVNGTLRAGNYSIPGNISSQFITGMLFALPLLECDSTVSIIGNFESRAYVDMTLAVLEKSGIVIKKESATEFFVKGGQKYQPIVADVEGDWSNAAFFYALNTLGGDVSMSGLKSDSRQGDRVCLEYFERLKQEGAVLDMSDCPDLAPIMFAVAAAQNGAVFTGTKRLAIKESNRATVMAEELSKFGAHVICEENRVEIIKTALHRPTEVLCGHNDHRIVMALAVLSTLTGGDIDGAEAISKSYPGFFGDLSKTGIKVTYNE